MKKQTLFLAFILTGMISVAQNTPGKMQIQIKDRLTKAPINSTSFTVTLNVTDTLRFISDSYGTVITGNLKAGKYTVDVNCANYEISHLKDIVIGNSKTAYLTFELIPIRPLKKEKKKLPEDNK